ncbi:hypothetical protein BSKO_00830 [Bryopsis sp. KO-2023]|nr:hypothetical protein BSKO_00830 [Bryopsis sp. KO-2023]
MVRDGRKVDNDIINRYFERAVTTHECFDDVEREDYSPSRPQRSYSGPSLVRNDANGTEVHHNSDQHDECSPSNMSRHHPPPPYYPPPGTYPMAGPPTWAYPSGMPPYSTWQPVMPVRNPDKRTTPIPPPPPPLPPPPPPPPPPGWPVGQASVGGSGEGGGSMPEPGGDMRDLLVSWYWAGYHAGMFAAGQKGK